MISDITPVLKRLNIKIPGRYEDGFYIIKLKDSDDYASMYSKLDELAVNTEDPSFGKNTNDTTIKITNYFETEIDGVAFDLFLIADFDTDDYQLKIKEHN